MILEFLAIAIWVLVGCAVYFVFLKDRKPETTQHLRNDLSKLSKEDFEKKYGEISRAVSEMEKIYERSPNSADKRIEEIRKLILETTEKVKNMKTQK